MASPHQWLNEPPWWPDYQLRLYRNDPFLRFAGHCTARPSASRLTCTPSSPLYHLDLLVNSLEDPRKRKAAFYDALRPGMEAPGGGSMNERYYLPEGAPRWSSVTSRPRTGRRSTRDDGSSAPVTQLSAPKLPVVPALKWISGSKVGLRPGDPSGHR